MDSLLAVAGASNAGPAGRLAVVVLILVRAEIWGSGVRLQEGVEATV